MFVGTFNPTFEWRSAMKRFFEKFQKHMAAAAFAEAGEWKSAREMTPEIKLNKELHGQP